MHRLENKVIIVTGASSGIGREAARLFAAEGGAIVVGARRPAELDSLVAEIGQAGGRAVALAGDVGDGQYQTDLVRLAVTEFGGLDYAFNNAGSLGASRPFADLSLEEWSQTMKTNLDATFLAAKAQIPAMLQRGKGALLFTSSFIGHTVAFPELADYAASKAGVIGLTMALAAEYGASAIRVNAILPGAVDTPMFRTAVTDDTAYQTFANLHALKRVGQTSELAKTALFLLSEEASFITGAAILADGGLSISRF